METQKMNKSINTKKDIQTENKTNKNNHNGSRKKRTSKKNRNCIQGTFTKHNTE